MKDRQEEWQQLYKLAMVERDPQKLRLMTARINELLAEEELRLMGEIRPAQGHIFHVCYEEGLLLTRGELLRRLGYEVVSALGNEDAKRLLKKATTYQILIVGHAAAKPVREEMVHWVRANFPGTKIIALNPPFESKLKGADYNFVLNGPDEWLAAVASVVSEGLRAPYLT